MTDLHLIVGCFLTQGEFAGVQPHRQGHIHDTYFVDCTGGARYVLQRMNGSIFPRPQLVMENIELVTSHQKKAMGEGAERRVLETIRTKDGGLCLMREDGCYRMYRLIEDAYAPETATLPVAEETGLAFGRFLTQMEGLDPRRLHEILHGFHDTPLRLTAFEQAVRENRAGRLRKAQALIDYILLRKEEMGLIVGLLGSGELPLRVTHNDTKPNNVLLDRKTDRALCVIDLDTVMPGSVLYDYGDMLRCGASTAQEDERDVDRIALDLQRAAAFTRGYIGGAGGTLTPLERELLPLGALTITLEQAMRFLTDYLNGDSYYKIAYPDHNFVRARAQIALHRSMENKRGEMEKITRR